MTKLKIKEAILELANDLYEFGDISAITIKLEELAECIDKD